jgi:hypothetical protein
VPVDATVGDVTEPYTLSTVVPTSKPPRPRWVLPVVSGLAVLLLLAAGGVIAYLALRPAAASSTASTMAVTGTVDVNDGADGRHYGQPCTTVGGYQDIAEGAAVVVSDSAGKTVALGRLGPGKGVLGNNDCGFSFTVNVPAGLGFYGIEVSHRGRIQYTEADLARPVQLSLGR